MCVCVCVCVCVYMTHLHSIQSVQVSVCEGGCTYSVCIQYVEALAVHYMHIDTNTLASQKPC